MGTANRIVIDPAICHGKPVIRGTRVAVTVIVGSLAGGMTFDDIQREYDVTADDIRAALTWVTLLARRGYRRVRVGMSRDRRIPTHIP